MKRLALTALASGLAIAAATPAVAAPLLSGTSGVTFNTFDPTTQGTLLDSLSSVGDAATFDAIMRTAVYRNTFGTLDFYYQVSLTQIDSGDEVNRLTGASFAGYGVDAFVRTTAGGIFLAAANPNSDGPGGTSVGFTSTASRNGNIATPFGGNVVRADFGMNGLEAAGETSATYIFRTNAVDFARTGTFATIDGSTVTITAFEAIGPAVPEPATWAMMIAGFGMIGGVMRRRKTTVAFA